MKDELLISKVTKLVNQYDETITPKSIHIDSKESLELDSVDLTNFIFDLEIFLSSLEIKSATV